MQTQDRAIDATEAREAERVRAVRSSGLIERGAPVEMCRLVELAVELTGSPMAAVAVLGARSEHLLCAVGLEALSADAAVALSGHCRRGADPVAYEDLRSVPGVAAHPGVVGPPHVRSYAGVPIHLGHQPVGALCVLDGRRRSWSSEELDVLRVLAGQVDSLVELHWRRGQSAPPTAEAVAELAASIHSSEEFDALLGNLSQAAWVFDPSTLQFLRVNEAAVERYGWSAEEFAAMTLADVRPERDAELFAATVRNSELLSTALNDEKMLSFWNSRRFVHRRRSGEPFEVWLGWADTDFEGRVARLAVITEVEASPQVEPAVEYAATHDPLTGLGNRSMLEATLQVLLAGDRQLCLAFIDIDRFRSVNDAAGQVRGDELIVSAAARLFQVLPEEATATRHGGDGFAVVLPEMDAQRAQHWADRVRLLLDEPYVLGGGEYRITVSIGIAAAEAHMTPAELVGRADDATYDAKRAGRDRVAVADSASRDMHLQRGLTAQRLAAAMDRSELVLHFQPIVALRGGRAGEVDEVEALLRWQRDRLELVLPEHFLGIAEDMGLMGPIGRWVIDESCAAAARWRDAGRDMRVSLNCSVQQFGPNLIDDVAASLAAHDLAGDRLIVEITEGALTRDHQLAIEVVDGLVKQGVEVVIDDFGTGYSSLDRLQDLSIRGLKIDRGFVLELARPQGWELYRAMVEIADAFGMEVTAEGVETPRQLRAVADLGCDLAQGHLLGRAGPETVVPEHSAFRIPGPT